MKIKKKILGALVFLASTVLVAPGHAWAQASAQTQQDRWRIMPTATLGSDGEICIGAACKKKQEDYAEQLLKICMYRDASTAGFFTSGEWRSHVGANSPQPCQEVLYADATRKVMYVVAPFQSAGSVYLAGQPYIYCISGSPSRPGLAACDSAFFTWRDAHSTGYKVVNVPGMQKVVQEAKVFDAIDRHLQTVGEQQKAQQRAEYLAAFGGAKGSLQAMKQFEDKYGSNDPDGLILQLAGVKQELRLEEYRTRFASMKTIPEIERFIADYEQDDVGKKVPEARLWLAHERQLEADAAKAQARQKAEKDGTARLSELERMVIWCKRESAAARRSIEQENQIGRVSGFVNKERLHAAGKTIVYCERSAPNDFDEYKRLGGKRSYGELR
ncbi:hypothetical protein [Hydrogenophaga sp. BPS33]|uniref:hypothetical protein n=1 Tax=Hydrogenophaga sp. BPS33 TaxID=2651974 RepID=UPI001320045F|nr:hypothetical protein [Hydrogenophaga sp. BPS33]QHE84731.1 hypothetical protein F9K07_07460 [Hydrogenophaga sp. BPS33]